LEALLELPLRSGSGSAPSFPEKLKAEAGVLPDFFRTAFAPDAILKNSNQNSKKYLNKYLNKTYSEALKIVEFPKLRL
jgi:hypothetical protein